MRLVFVRTHATIHLIDIIVVSLKHLQSKGLCARLILTSCSSTPPEVQLRSYACVPHYVIIWQPRSWTLNFLKWVLLI